MKNMDESQFIAEKQGQMAIKMVEIGRRLSQPELTDQDRMHIRTLMTAILNISMGKDKGFSMEISALAKGVALRTLNDLYADIFSAEIVPFGNGAHITLPKDLIGKTIRYVVD